MAKRVLIIDDCKFTRTVAQDILQGGGLEVVTASSGLEANQHIYADTPPDLILIDVVMPMLHGDKKVQLLKERESSRDIPIVLISSKSSEELEDLVKSSGANGYLQKPLNKDNLLQVVQKHL